MRYDALIIGGGPAGAAAAIRLAQAGARVAVLEEKRFPRGKLCGEFITPEAFPSLRRLGVMDRMLGAGAARLTHMALVSMSGRTVAARIADMSDAADWAMSLSRARFDQILFDRAREAGADCFEGVAVSGALRDRGHRRGVEALRLGDGKTVTFEADFIIDASGRNSRLSVGRRERLGGRQGARLYAMKAHLANVSDIDERVELYFFPQGYGGLSRVEGGLANLCFIVSEAALKAAGGDGFEVVRRSVMRNRLAAARLANAEPAGRWYAAGPLRFGTGRLAQGGVLAVGDASGMIDPFTGTGLQIALRTGEMAAEAILAGAFAEAARRYAEAYRQEFGRRMRVAGWLRRAALSPRLAGPAAGVLAGLPWLARRVLKATRSGRPGP